MKVRSLVATLLLTLVAPASHTQDTGSNQQLFQVEVIVFRHADQSGTTREIQRSVEPQIADVLDQQLPRLGSGDRKPADSTSASVRWRPASGQLYLARDADRINRLQAYELISHLSWVQPAPDIAVAAPVSAAKLGAPAPIDGEFKLYSKRFVHLAVEIQLNDNLGRSGPAIIDSRRMRYGRTAYFDQPQFGVIAVINRVGS
ncbi:MAG: hypothetical protein HKN56_07220 [Gammaproteobacteria bacterium]|nr:peptidoglycan binding protein CsiV [Gammaproteobacteria bacterium]NND54745.1 hypothetical protein [Gammaproteobacteria bacterium]